MKVFESEEVRNVALAGHSGSGKSSLAEAVLFDLKVTDRLGNTTDGTTVSDYGPEEIKRNHSVSLGLLNAAHKTTKINLLDLPGRRDFVGDCRSGMRVADGVVLVVDGTAGVQAGTEFAMEYADEFGINSRIAFVNKLDKERADFDKALAEFDNAFSARAVAVTIPVGKESDFRGVIDLTKMKFAEEKDKKVTYGDIPAEMTDAAEEARAILVEAAAEGDDDLMMKFLEDEPLSDEEVLQGLKGAMLEGRVIPVCAGSSTTLLGVLPLLDLIQACIPNPLEGPGVTTGTEGSDEEGDHFKVESTGDTLAYVFKTVSDPYAGHLNFFKVMRGEVKGEGSLNNVNRDKAQRLAHILCVCGKKNEEVEKLCAGDIGAVAKLDATHTNDTLSGGSNGSVRFAATPMAQPTVHMAVTAKNSADEDKVGLGFHRLTDQDPTLHLHRDPEISQTILSGMGGLQLEVAVSQLKDTAKVEVELKEPKVPYRETITKKVEGQGKYKKQSGGRGQFGDCWLRLEPRPEGAGFEFEWAIVGGSIPTKFQPAVEKGLIEAMEKGALSGSPTVDLKAVCYDGSYHDVDSSEMAFKVAASMAFKNLVVQANPIILEPIYKLTVTVPDQNLGDIMGDLSGRRGRVLGTTASGKRQIVEATAPLAEMFSYRRDLHSMTHGRGFFQMEFDHYDRVPGDEQKKIVESHQKEEG